MTKTCTELLNAMERNRAQAKVSGRKSENGFQERNSRRDSRM